MYRLEGHVGQVQRGIRLRVDAEGHIPGTPPNHLPRYHPERLPICFKGTTMGHWSKMPHNPSYRGGTPRKFTHIRIEPYITENDEISEAMAYCHNTAETTVWYNYNEVLTARVNQHAQERGAKGDTDVRRKNSPKPTNGTQRRGDGYPIRVTPNTGEYSPDEINIEDGILNEGLYSADNDTVTAIERAYTKLMSNPTSNRYRLEYRYDNIMFNANSGMSAEQADYVRHSWPELYNTGEPGTDPLEGACNLSIGTSARANEACLVNKAKSGSKPEPNPNPLPKELRPTNRRVINNIPEKERKSEIDAAYTNVPLISDRARRTRAVHIQSVPQVGGARRGRQTEKRQSQRNITTAPHNAASNNHQTNRNGSDSQKRGQLCTQTQSANNGSNEGNAINNEENLSSIAQVILLNIHGLNWEGFIELVNTYFIEGKHAFLVLTEVQVRYMEIAYDGLVFHTSLRGRGEKKGGGG